MNALIAAVMPLHRIKGWLISVKYFLSYSGLKKSKLRRELTRHAGVPKCIGKTQFLFHLVNWQLSL